MAGDFHAAPPALFEEVGNDLEAVTIKRYPEIGDIKKELKKAGEYGANVFLVRPYIP